jgi:upstream activation factor subunit UAF30
VKELWAYIKQHGLQDEANKRDIVCDEAMQNIFKVKKINMFAMNKALGE